MQVPWMLGLIATRSIDTPVPGIIELVGQAQDTYQGRHDRL